MPWVKNSEKPKTRYLKVKDFAQIFNISDKTVYQMIKNPIFEEAIKKIGTRGIRLDEEKMTSIMSQYYR